MLFYFSLTMEINAHFAENGVSRPGIGLDIATSHRTATKSVLIFRYQPVDRSIEHSLIRNLKASAQFQKILSLTEALVVGPDEDRDAVDCSLRYVVNAHAESAAHISDVRIAIDTGEQTEAVDDQAIRILDVCIAILNFRIAERRAMQLVLYLAEMLFVYDVRSQNELQVRMVVEIRDYQVFIRSPTAAGDEGHILTSELLNQGQVFCLLANIQDTVETGVAHDGHVVDDVH